MIVLHFSTDGTCSILESTADVFILESKIKFWLILKSVNKLPNLIKLSGSLDSKRPLLANPWRGKKVCMTSEPIPRFML